MVDHSIKKGDKKQFHSSPEDGSRPVAAPNGVTLVILCGE